MEQTQWGQGGVCEDVYADQSVAESWVLIVTEKEPAATNKASENERELDSTNGGGDGNIWDIEWDSAVGRGGLQDNANASAKNAEQEYYYNRLSGETSYTAPPNYADINERRGGWALCCNEESDWAYSSYYWFHHETGESAWVEEVEG